MNPQNSSSGCALSITGAALALGVLALIYLVTFVPIFGSEGEPWLFVAPILMPLALPGYVMLLLAAARGYRTTLARCVALAVPVTAGLLGLTLLWISIFN